MPAGGVEAGETVIEAAQREVKEETGNICKDYEQIYIYYPMNGIANKQFHIVVCMAFEQLFSLSLMTARKVGLFLLEDFQLIRACMQTP